MKDFYGCLAVAVAMMSQAAFATLPDDECRARSRLDLILNAGIDVTPGSVGREETTPSIALRVYDIIDPFAVAVAIGDYESARMFGDRVVERLKALFAEVSGISATVSGDDPARQYARLVVGAAIARVSLVDYRWLDAVRYGAIARDGARALAGHPEYGEHARFYLGLYEYYTAVAPMWVRGLGYLGGVVGDRRTGLDLLEETVNSNNALAPEAARVLLEEVRERDRPNCRYLPLAADLAASYPHNYRFRWYLERERARCEDEGIGGGGRPRLAFGYTCASMVAVP